jgi:cupin fold WbuC family metalloprotein
MQEAGPQLISRALFDELIERARRSPRLRTNHNFHGSAEENPHRFLNVMLRGTYITPHRHLDPPKAESFLVVEGEVAFLAYDDAGGIARVVRIGRDPIGIDVQPGVWHNMVVLSEHAICFEVKPGPYAPASDKEFAPWAPREGDPRAQAYLNTLLHAVR